MVEEIIASGPVIIEEGKLLVSCDGKDLFYKIPGGKPFLGESLEDCAIRECREETGYLIQLGEKLSTMYLDKKPGTGEVVEIELHHYLARIVGGHDFNSFEYNSHAVEWLKLEDVLNGKYNVSPNIQFLLERGELK